MLPLDKPQGFEFLFGFEDFLRLHIQVVNSLRQRWRLHHGLLLHLQQPRPLLLQLSDLLVQATQSLIVNLAVTVGGGSGVGRGRGGGGCVDKLR